MKEIIKTKHDLCTGCNRCVRECPMETANITYQDEFGKIKVIIDYEKCVACGRCITACKHDARYYEDDTERFFDDLKNGTPISLMSAPAIRTNIPEYKRLFTYLKQLGVNKIYDVSLGADLCIWGYVRYCEKNNAKPIITQPCPVIVTYCEMYRPDLLEYLAPVQSPMASLAVYMKEYEGITDNIVALSPCVAKTHEFEGTGLSEYNVTFAKLCEYLEKNNIELPVEETGFDHYECGLGSLFPMPGGLKENIEFFTGKSLSIDKAEGNDVFEKLNIYASTPEESLPRVFDVLNCGEGCNIGTACTHSANVFEINRKMDKNRVNATGSRKREYFENLYKKYDETFDFSLFMRKYKPITAVLPYISHEDIDMASNLLNKTDNEKQNIDCGACGSDTCHEMARKIALGVNIPTNCIMKAMETAKEEHERSLNTLEQFAMIWSHIESGAMIMDAETREILDVNPAAVAMYGGTKEDMVGKKCYNCFGNHDCPLITLQQTMDKEERKFIKADGTLIPVIKSVSKIKYNGRPALLESFTDISYLKEIEEQKSMLEATERMQVMLDATPLCAHFWDRNGNLIDCNHEAIKLFNMSSKQEYMNRYDELTPEYQPDGRPSRETSSLLIEKAFNEGYQRFEWMRQMPDGEPIPVEVTLVCVDYKDDQIIAAYTRDLREQKRMIKEISATTARLGTVVSNYPGIIWSVDSDNKIVLYNGQYINNLGFTPHFMEGKDLEMARKDNRHLDIIENVKKTFEIGPQDWVSEVDGKMFRSRTSPIRDEKGRITGVVGNTDDMTEIFQLQTELKDALAKAEAGVHALEAAQATTSSMFEANPHINILFNSEFKVVDCNPAAIKFMEFDSKDEMLDGFVERMTKSIPEFQPDGRPSETLYQKLITAAKEGSVIFETSIILNGIERSLNVEFKKIPYEGSFAIVGYVIDMTEVHEREMELRRSRQLNELQLAKLNLVVQASKIGLWDMEVVKDDPVNLNNRIIYSDEFRYMLGYSDENDFPNVLGSWANLLHPEDFVKSVNAFSSHLLDTTGKTPYDIEFQMLRKDGEYAYYHASGESIREKDGTPIRVAGALVDITETKNILLDTERQKLEAEAANKAKSAFLSTMSHEIRTPMNAILGITEIQMQNDSLDQSVKEALNKIYASGDLLLGIINDILDLSKIEAGKLELITAKYEIASFISDTAQLNMMRIGSKPIEFELYVDENLPVYMMGDELRVKQILNNILSNAFKYTAEGTVKLSVSSEAINNNKNQAILVVSVSDTGQGMTKEQVNKLFDEYSRFNMEANRSTEGTGLGMSITRNLIRMMEGEIFIDSEPGEGSTFTVRLPQGLVDNQVLGSEMAENLHQFRTSSRAQMKRVQITRELMPYGKVLIVDDVETNIYVAKGLMTPYGLNIDSADSGFAAIEKIKDGKVYDIIFMDHMMPQMDGIETTQKIRAMGYTKSIVALTANAVAGQADIFLGNGFDDFISKPIDVRQLNAVLNKLIRDKQPPEVIKAARNQSQNKPETPANDNAAQQAMNARFAEIFARDAAKSLAALEAIDAKKGVYNEDDIRTYIIHVHGMKSALANMKKLDLSSVAFKLEQLGRDGNTGLIASETPAFIKSLRAYMEELKPKNENARDETTEENKSYLRESLLTIKTACEEYDESTADKLITELRKKTWPQTINDLLGTIAEQLLHSDFDEIVEKINKFMET